MRASVCFCVSVCLCEAICAVATCKFFLPGRHLVPKLFRSPEKEYSTPTIRILIIDELKKEETRGKRGQDNERHAKKTRGEEYAEKC